LAGQEALKANVLIQVWPVDAFAARDEAVVSALGHGRELVARVEPDGDDQHLSVLKVDTHEIRLEGDAPDFTRPCRAVIVPGVGFHEAQYSVHSKLQVATGADRGSGHGFTFGKTMGDFVSDDGAEFGIGGLFLVAVADTAKVEVRAVADVALVLI
jgi:hypothetical protein